MRPGLDQTEPLNEGGHLGASPGSLGDMQIRFLGVGPGLHLNKLPSDSDAAPVGEALGQCCEWWGIFGVSRCPVQGGRHQQTLPAIVFECPRRGGTGPSLSAHLASFLPQDPK